MIGNDIVDLQQARRESNWKRPRFLEKIFTREEQQFIQSATNKELAVWTLWSRKESVYKIVARLGRKRFYAPRKIHSIQLNSAVTSSLQSSEGQVVFEAFSFVTRSVVTKEFIHTVAGLTDAPCHVTSNCFSLEKDDYSTQHKMTRKEVLKEYALQMKVSDKELRIEKDELNVPYLYYKNKQQPVMVSMAHHGFYGGYALAGLKKGCTTEYTDIHAPRYCNKFN